jgi:hypothetical protein
MGHFFLWIYVAIALIPPGGLYLLLFQLLPVVIKWFRER